MKRIAVILAILLLTGCYRIRYQVSPPSPRGSLYTDQRWNNYFLFGFVPSTDEYMMGDLCRGGELKEVRSYRSPGNVLATILSAGLSSASTIETSCLQTR